MNIDENICHIVYDLYFFWNIIITFCDLITAAVAPQHIIIFLCVFKHI